MRASFSNFCFYSSIFLSLAFLASADSPGIFYSAAAITGSQLANYLSSSVWAMSIPYSYYSNSFSSFSSLEMSVSTSFVSPTITARSRSLAIDS